ncbi:MAG: FAD-dependent oxidoreductase [Lewinellaceae bacterium]|nr:FAD-dependent oxidoreductase [Phaeodactylibacter sp.]MCB9040084.1 FAD-dependent oxidoreductase [Lewinellaceae bacterium]
MSYQEAKVVKVSDLQNGEMKQAKVGDTDILIAKVEGKFHALYAKCTHYGAPLADGILNGRRLVCPWHHACFDVKTGRHLEACGMDGLPTYDLRIEGEDVIVRVPDGSPDRVANIMARPEPANTKSYAIIGGGAAAAYAAEGMREAGFTGRIAMINAEEELPYDRPNCSKEYLQGEAPEEWMPLRPESFYKEHGITLLKGHKVARVDPGNKKIHFEKGEPLAYDKLLIATGSTPRRLPVPGADSKNVRFLRSLRDSRELRELGKAADKAVIIGSSFIGLESAMSLQHLDCEVTVVAPEDLPFARVWGKAVGQRIRQWHEEAGVQFRLGRTVKHVYNQSNVSSVELDDGSRLEANLILVGIGVQPATGFLEGIAREEDGGIRVDEYLQAGQDIYAAGDIAHYPANGKPVRIEHWKVACQQGRVAGMNMAGARLKYQAVPFFWSAQQDKVLGYVGHVKDYEQTIVEGDLDGDSFLVHYAKGGAIRATLSLFRDADLCAIQELMLEGRMPGPEEVKKGVDWVQLLRK